MALTNVLPSGAFDYNVPIEIPGGTAGVQPSLSLNYNSQGGDGILGSGWSLGGIPKITRDLSYDVNWDDHSDHFIFNGQKLIPDPDDPTVYYTEQYSGQIIKCVWIGNNIASWQVLQKDGSKFIFGKTLELSEVSDGYIAAVGKNDSARLWSLSKVVDRNGNFYLIRYIENQEGNGDYYPDRIVYTYNNGISKYKAILFSYEDREDFSVKYIPSKVNQNKRISAIEVKIGVNYEGTGGYLLRKYQMEYKSTKISQLVSLQEYGSDGNSIKPPMSFIWNEEEKLLDSGFSILEGQDLGYSDRHWKDFNGDGLSDYICRVGNEPNTFYKVHLSEGDGVGPGFYVLEGQDIGEEEQRYWIDFNGDGKTDYVCQSGAGFIVYLSNGSGLEPGFRILDGHDLGYGDRVWSDFNGDGKPDYICRVGNNHDIFYKVHLSEGDGVGPGFYVLEGQDIGEEEQRYWIDFNGDGKTDYVCQSGAGFLVYLSNGSGLEPGFRILDGHDLGYGDRVWSDFNGDGKPDYICRVGNSPNYFFEIHNSFGNQKNINIIKNGQGGTISIQYKAAPQLSGAILTDLGFNPVVALKSSRYLVTRIESFAGLGVISSSRYEYYNGKYLSGFMADRKGLGFEWIKTINNQTGAYSKTVYYQEEDDVRFAGMVKRQDNYGFGGALYISVENSYKYREKIESSQDYHGVNFIWLSDTYSYNYNGDQSAPPVINWQHIDEPDELGNTIRTINYGESLFDDSNPAVIIDAYPYDNVINEIHYAQPLGNFTVPIKKIQRAYGLDQFDSFSNPSLISTEIRYFYDDYNDDSEFGIFDKGLLTKEIHENGENDVLLTYGNDFWGNRIWLRDTMNNIQELERYTEQKIYDDEYHCYLVSTINALGQSKSIVYDNGENSLMLAS